MSDKPPRKPAGKNRPQQRKGRTAVAAKSARKQTDRTAWIIAGVVIAVGVALIIAFAGKGSNADKVGAISGREKAPASLVSKVSGISDDVINEVGKGSVNGLPKKLPGPTLTTEDGKPRIIYMGAEYCPYCAVERWGLVQALSRFGEFKNLSITTSAERTQVGSPEIFPNTATFTFHGSTYTSPYIQFEPSEQSTNTFQPLDKPTDEQQALDDKYNAPPYVDAQSAGSIPFIDFANEYLISGASYDAGTLTDQTHVDIAAGMNDAGTDIAKGALGTANVITATICKVNDNKPANVCNTDAVKAIQAELPTEVESVPAK